MGVTQATCGVNYPVIPNGFLSRGANWVNELHGLAGFELCVVDGNSLCSFSFGVWLEKSDGYPQ